MATMKRSHCLQRKLPALRYVRSKSLLMNRGLQTVDPLGGSYFLENQTLQMETGAFDYFGKLDAMGGMIKAIERGYPQKEIAEASYQYQRAVEAREKVIVGANEFVIA